MWRLFMLAINIPHPTIMRPISRSIVPFSQIVRYVGDVTMLGKKGEMDYSAFHNAMVCYLKVTDEDFRACHHLEDIDEVWLVLSVDDGENDFINWRD